MCALTVRTARPPKPKFDRNRHVSSYTIRRLFTHMGMVCSCAKDIHRLPKTQHSIIMNTKRWYKDSIKHNSNSLPFWIAIIVISMNLESMNLWVQEILLQFNFLCKKQSIDNKFDMSQKACPSQPIYTIIDFVSWEMKHPCIF